MAHYDNTLQEALEIIGLCDVLLRKFKAHLDVAMRIPLQSLLCSFF